MSISIDPRRDQNRTFTGISSHPSFRANVHFAFANNAETCAEIITKPGKQERAAVSEPRNDTLCQLWSSLGGTKPAKPAV